MVTLNATFVGASRNFDHQSILKITSGGLTGVLPAIRNKIH